MKFHATIHFHFESESVESAGKKLRRITYVVEDSNAEVCQVGYSEDKAASSATEAPKEEVRRLENVEQGEDSGVGLSPAASAVYTDNAEWVEPHWGK